MTGRDEFRGSKFEAGRDVKDIAKAVRKDIAAAIKAGELPAMKTSVTIERFSGGCALRVKVKEIAGGALNPDHVRANAANPYRHEFDLPPRYLPHAKAALETLKKIVRAYKRDASDSMVDYFDVNFYDSVDFSTSFENEERKAILAAPAPEPEPEPEAVDEDGDGDDDPDGGPSGSPAPEGEDGAEAKAEAAGDAYTIPTETEAKAAVEAEAKAAETYAAADPSDVRRQVAAALDRPYWSTKDFDVAVAGVLAVPGVTVADLRSVGEDLTGSLRLAEMSTELIRTEQIRRGTMAARKAEQALLRRDENVATVLRLVREEPRRIELRPGAGDDGGLLGSSLRAERENRAAVAALSPQAAPEVEVEAETPPTPVRALDRRQAAARFDAILVAAVEALVEVDSDAAAAAIFALVDRSLEAAVETLAGTGGVADLSEEVWGACARTDLEAHGWASAKALRSHLEKTYG